MARVEPDRLYTEPFVLAPTEAGLALSQMRLADSPEASARVWQSLPPHFWYAEVRARTGAVVLAEHPTLRAASGERLPLIAGVFSAWPGKTVFHAVDSTYLWRNVADEKHYARYWLQTIRFLAHTRLLGQDRRAELTTDRRVYRHDAAVELQLRFLAEQEAPGEGEAPAVTVESPSAKRSVRLERRGPRRGVFVANITDLPPGAYHVRLTSPMLQGIVPAADFIVSPPAGELDRLQVDLADLSAAVQATGGKLYRLDTASDLSRDLPAGRHTPTTRLPDVPLWNSWPVPIVLLLLLGSEWILRKRSGML
jgi:hypothetical protein